MNLLLDMNLPRSWVGFLNNAGHDAVHWASVGDPRAEDVEIMEYARSEARVVFTHDLDFGMLLALTRGGWRRAQGAALRWPRRFRAQAARAA